jgi:hypothetical protein
LGQANTRLNSNILMALFMLADAHFGGFVTGMKSRARFQKL